ncbi:MAG: mannose-6-phosphate isomerase [Paludibacter sp.]|nr:mannose-6-phosphate isomerase [Paludibacter sp.]
MIELYPFKFTPVLKDKIWGGAKLQKLFDKQASTEKLGESWELSDVAGDESVVSNGELKGLTLHDLIKKYQYGIVGKKIYEKYGGVFPLLFKLIDANDNLSIQVHPGDETAKVRHNSFGKTEMWYVVDAEPGASLIIGFTKDCSKQQYLDALNQGVVESLLQKVPVVKGDVLFIPAGLVHAIGKGVVVAEIQQSSDITYRIYDYKRKDENGNERELHVDQALDVINFSASPEPKTKYSLKENEVCPLVRCDYFRTNKIDFTHSLDCDYSGKDSFVVYMCLSGNFYIECADSTAHVTKGETVLIPAQINHVKLIPEEKSELLEVYI